jgi:hypothetical protein
MISHLIFDDNEMITNVNLDFMAGLEIASFHIEVVLHVNSNVHEMNYKYQFQNHGIIRKINLVKCQTLNE